MNKTRIRRQRIKTISARTVSLGSNAKRADTSRQVYQEDLYATQAAGVAPLAPPYNPDFLFHCYTISNIMRQCIEAYVTNIASFGYEVVPVDKDVPMNEDERRELQSFIDYANSEQSMATMAGEVVVNYETFGYGYIEVIRDRRRRPSFFRSAGSRNIRLLTKHPEDDQVEVNYTVFRGGREITVREFRSFRRYVQIVNGKYRYFKEFGDPRKLDYETGQFESETYRVTVDKEATELLHYKQFSDEPYGIPRWINQLPSILGSREAEECNLRYFEDNTIPPIIMSIAGGRLTTESFNKLQSMLKQQQVGKDRQNQIMLVEAIPEREGLDDKGSVEIKIDKLTDSRQSDALFKDYDERNATKVRSSFRLPPIAVGMSEDHNYATANVASFLVETQVYSPERNRMVELLNKRLVNSPEGLGMTTVMLSAKTPPITNSETIIKSMTALNVMGALTPRMCNKAADGLLQMEIPDYPEIGEDGYEEWMDRPIQFVTRGVKSQTGQEAKDQKVKDLEEDGDVSAQNPEHGEE